MFGAAEQNLAGGGSPVSFEAEESLVRSARQGDLQAFNKLILTYQDGLYRWVDSLVQDRDLAEDVVQSTFITAFEKLSSFRGGSFRAWLFKIGRNRSFDELRKRRRFPSISLDGPTGPEEDSSPLSFIPDDSLAVEEAVEQAQQAEMVSRLLERLPEIYRQVLRLADMEEMNYQEVAELLDLPLGTVKSRLARARLKFQRLALGSKLHPAV